MRNLTKAGLEPLRDTSERVISHYGGTGDETCGVFRVKLKGANLLVVASSAGGWEHVSVSLRGRTPTWGEMDYVKQLFFENDEVAVQFHVTDGRKVDIHPNCLHLWRAPGGLMMPMPPKEFV
jgi:hypothetical protein